MVAWLQVDPISLGVHLPILDHGHKQERARMRMGLALCLGIGKQFQAFVLLVNEAFRDW